MGPLLLYNLILTWLIETPVYVAGLRRFGVWQPMLFSLLVSGFTLPPAHYSLFVHGSGFITTEILVGLTESALLNGIFRTGWKQALTIAGAANALSALCGWLIGRII